jgi:hypothetical protein
MMSLVLGGLAAPAGAATEEGDSQYVMLFQTGRDVYIRTGLTVDQIIAGGFFATPTDLDPGFDVQIVGITHDDTGYTMLFQTGRDVYIRTGLTVDQIIAGGFFATPTNLDPGFDVQIVGFSIEGPPDADGDGIGDNADNCPTTANADQADLDADGIGDACDDDRDGDDVPNSDDAFPDDPTESSDADGDGIGDNADPDDDDDGVDDVDDVCPGTRLPDDPTRELKPNHYRTTGDGFVDADGEVVATLADTGGCSSSQIVEEAGLGSGHLRFGISRSALSSWITTIG